MRAPARAPPGSRQQRRDEWILEGERAPGVGGGLGGGPAFGGKGYFAATPEALHQALAEALKTNAPTLINTMISPYGQRKAQVR